MERRTILIVGDSLSAGYGLEKNQSWVTLLQDRLMSKGYDYKVVNASISGDTTTGGVQRLPRALETHQPYIVLIELGGNDGLRGTPISTIRNNLENMILLSQKKGAKVVLAGMVIPPNYGAEYTNQFADTYPKLAETYNTALIKFFLEGMALDRSLFQPDQIHPTAEAQPILLNNVWQVMKPLL